MALSHTDTHTHTRDSIWILAFNDYQAVLLDYLSRMAHIQTFDAKCYLWDKDCLSPRANMAHGEQDPGVSESTGPSDRAAHHFHLIDGRTEVQRGDGSCPRSVAAPGLESM